MKRKKPPTIYTTSTKNGSSAWLCGPSINDRVVARNGSYGYEFGELDFFQVNWTGQGTDNESDAVLWLAGET